MLDNKLKRDIELFALIAEGNEQAFAEFFNLYLPRMTTFAMKITDDHEGARDVVQEAFLQLWMGRDKLAAIEHPAGWIYTIASRQAYKYLRRRMIKDNAALAMDVGQPEADPIGLDELRYLISASVNKLSTQRKKIFLLSRNQGLTIPQIAIQLDLSENTVKNTLVSALKQVRELLEAEGYLLPLLILLWQ